LNQDAGQTFILQVVVDANLGKRSYLSSFGQGVLGTVQQKRSPQLNEIIIG